ncbi:hypothetical protein N7520_005304 [Penicillium odoratum]|uniref:uncharacterized protein n=1 Tax=Penicillium odoratum TaxID=1167516 RepID=UPI002547E6EE|nr:uncharacterized protein N7520_005304 [Penicillium odoratum]KAJ5765745.1 hypothetical protein N7520_005304 [Penicillium odoratum]
MAFENYFPSATPIFKYEGKKHLLEIWEQKYYRNIPFLIFKMDESTFLTDFIHTRNEKISKIWKSYEYSSNNLLIEMNESKPHAAAADEFKFIIMNWAKSVSEKRLLPWGSYPVARDSGFKKPDGAWGPKERLRWPTIVFEVGVTEFAESLQNNMKNWLENSEGAVNVALSIRVTKTRVTVARWDLENNSERSAFISQSMFMTRRSKIPRISGHLGFSYEEAFLESPQGEGKDFTLTEELLRDFVTSVWDQWDNEEQEKASSKQPVTN